MQLTCVLNQRLLRPMFLSGSASRYEGQTSTQIQVIR